MWVRYEQRITLDDYLASGIVSRRSAMRCAAVTGRDNILVASGTIPGTPNARCPNAAQTDSSTFVIPHNFSRLQMTIDWIVYDAQ